MNRSDHLNTAQLLVDRADNLRQIGENVLAGEALWGAIVHGVSAADPEHEIQPPTAMATRTWPPAPKPL